MEMVDDNGLGLVIRSGGKGLKMLFANDINRFFDRDIKEMVDDTGLGLVIRSGGKRLKVLFRK